MSKQSHIERTAHEPRDPSLHTLTITDITHITPNIRLFRLQIPPDDTITFLPGQWVDLYPPPEVNIPKPGGFTITSSPTLAFHSPSSPTSTHSSPSPPYPYIELAIQSSPTNPPAAYLFLPAQQLLHTQVQVRIGGSFVFPPPSLPLEDINPGDSLRKIVFVAGGMGINPLMSMLSSIGEQSQKQEQLQPGVRTWGSCEVRLLYSVKDPGGAGDGGHGGARDSKGILFLDRIVESFESGKVRGRLGLFLTGGESATGSEAGEADGADKGLVRYGSGVDVPFLRRRMSVRDVEKAVGEDKEAALVYVCGVPAMTDHFVEALTSPGGLGMDKRRVLFEKWW